MAETSIPSGMTEEQWDHKYHTEYVNQNWFKRFEGRGMNNMIQIKEDLTKAAGDAITVSLRTRLTGNATDQNGTLEGNEEDLDFRTFRIQVREYSHAVRFKQYDQIKTGVPLREAHRDALMDWNMELDRDNIIEALASINGVAYGAASESQKDAWLADNADRVLFGAAKSNNSGNDHSASLANIDNSADKLTSTALSLMKRMAKTATRKIHPIRPRSSVSGSDMFVVFTNSLGLRDLRADSAFLQANREARTRGKQNPLFADADYVWDNLAIYEIEDIATLTGVGAGGIDVAPVYLCGAQALAKVWAQRPKTVEETFDYRRKKGLSIQQVYKIEKCRFGLGDTDTDDPVDHGVVTGYFAAVADA